MSSCGRVCGHYIFLVTGGKYYRFLDMDGEVVQLGQSIIIQPNTFYVVFRSKDQMVPNLAFSGRNCKQRSPSYFGGPKT